MIKLPPPISLQEPIVAGKECFEEIWDEAQHSIQSTQAQLAAIRRLWQQRIEQYVTARGGPTVGGSPFNRRPSIDRPKEAGDLMFDRYRSGNSTDKNIVNHAHRVAVGYCPYCGLFLRRKPNNANPDRDHVRPRSLFPEFSLLRLNLVIACDDCNSAKLDHDLNENGDWIFIHPYFDDFLADIVLTCEVSSIDGTPVLRFSLSPVLEETNLRRLERHVQILDIFSRYADDPLRQAVQLLETHRRYFREGLADVSTVRKHLEDAAREVRTSRPNDPLGAIIYGFARSSDLEALLRGRT